MNIEEEIENQLKIMEDKVNNKKFDFDKVVGNNTEYIPCKNIIEKYNGRKKEEFYRRLQKLIPEIDFHN